MRKLATAICIVIAVIVSLANGAQAQLSIMPLGDSITEGLGVTNIPGGYRTELYTDLTNANIPFNYVGSATTNPSATLTAAAVGNPTLVDHEGHGGYRVDQIANNLDGNDTSGNGVNSNDGGYWFPGGNGTGRGSANPSVILLHVGTNDVVQGFDPNAGGNFVNDLSARLDSLVNQITTDRPNALLLLSSIIPINGNSTWESRILQYNADIENVIVPKYDALGRHVEFVDQFAHFVDGSGNILTSLLQADGIHPTQAGYDVMGDVWFNAIESAESVSTPEPGSAILLGLAFVALASFWAISRRRTRPQMQVAVIARNRKEQRS